MRSTLPPISKIGTFVRKSSVLERHYNRPFAKSLRDEALNSTPASNGKLHSPISQVLFQSKEILPTDWFSPVRQIAQVAKGSPEQVLLITKFKHYTAKEIYEEAKKVAYGLRAIGVKEGDSVAFMTLPTDEKSLIYLYGALMIGAVYVPINFLLPDKKIPKLFDKSQAKILVVGKDSRLRAGANNLSTCFLENVITLEETKHHLDSSFSNQLSKMQFHYPVRGELERGLHYVLRIVKATAKPFIQAILSTAAYNPLAFTDSYIRSLGELKDEEITLDPPKYAPSIRIFSSGTTKTQGPTLVEYSHEMIALAVESTCAYFDITKKDKMLYCLSDYHLASLIVKLGSMNYKCPLVVTDIPTNEDPRSIPRALKRIVDNKVTVFPGAPKLISPVLDEAINNKKINSIDSLRLIFSGGAALTPYLIEQVKTINIDREKRNINPLVLVDFHASTECGPYLCNVLVPSSSGTTKKQLIYPGVKVRLSDDEESELLVHTLTIPSYFQEDQMCEIEGVKYFRTCDRYKIDSDGALKYAGRLVNDHQINKNAKKMQTEEIEEIIEDLPYVKEVQVFGLLEEDERDHIACAIIIPKDNPATGKPYEIKSKEIRELLHRRFNKKIIKSRIYIPEVILIKDCIPAKLSRVPGKVPKGALVSEYEAEARVEYEKFKQSYRHKPRAVAAPV